MSIRVFYKGYEVFNGYHWDSVDPYHIRKLYFNVSTLIPIMNSTPCLIFTHDDKTKYFNL